MNAKQAATFYLSYVLGDRSGLNFRDVIQDRDIEDEVVNELAEFLDKYKNGQLQ